MRPEPRKPRYDPAEIRRRASLMEVVREVVPELRREGREWCGRCPFHSEKTGSFFVNEAKGVFICYGCGKGGDVIEFVKQLEGKTFGEALDYLAGRVGLAPSPGLLKPLKPRAPVKSPEADERRKAQSVEIAHGIWRDTVVADMTMAEAYLMGRGIDTAALGQMPPRIRFATLLKHTKSGKSFPAMVAAITGHGGRFLGVQRTFLVYDTPDKHPKASAAMRARAGEVEGPGRVVVKAPVEAAKTMLGIAMGGCVCIAQAGPVLAIAEGIETALSVRQMTGLPCWAALSLGNMGGVPVPDVVREVRLFADNDMKDPAAAEKLIQSAARKYREQGLQVSIVRAPKGMDFNDVVMEDFA